MSGTIAKRADDFVNSVGVCAHLEETSTSYANEALVESEMLYLGAHNARVVLQGTSAATIASLAELGIRFDVIANSSNLASDMSSLNAIAPYVESVEGPNEVDAVPITYDGLSGVPAAIAFQKDLYAAVKSDTSLSGAAVLPFSVAQNTTALATYGDVSPYADYGNLHAYASFGVPPSWWMSQVLKTTDAPERQTIITETGNYTLMDGASGVSQDVQAKYMIDTVLDAFNAGVAQTYIYQLMDPAADPSGNNVELHWGLFNPDGTPKLAATALHNLLTVLADNSATAASFTPESLAYTITGLPSVSGFSSLLEASAGTFDLQLWQEPLLWNEQTRSENTLTPSNVTVTLGSVAYEVQVFDPLVGTAPIATYFNTNAVTVALGADALVLKITPTGTVTAVGTPSAPVIAGLSSGTDTGASSTDGVTSDVRPTIVGTAMAGALVTVYDGSTVIGTAVATGDGAWALSPVSALANGIHTLTAVASSLSGSSPVSSGYAVVISTAPPAASFVTDSLPTGSTIQPTQTMTFRVNLSEPILLNTAAGTPTLSLNSGGVATFNASASTSTALSFTYTVLGGQSAANLAATGIQLNGATARDLAGNAWTGGSLAGIPGSSTGVTVSDAPLPVYLGSGPQNIVVDLSEYAWQGDAQVVLRVDGTQVGGVETVTATHGQQTQPFTLSGNWGRGSHVVSVTFTNQLWQGTLQADRKVYVDDIRAGGVTQPANGSLLFDGTLTFNSPVLWTPTTPVLLGSGPQDIRVNVSESAWQGDAQFTLAVDGTQIGGVQTATAEHAAGLSQAFTLAGTFSPGVHVVTVTPLNYAYGGAMPLQRFVDVDSISAAGTTTAINTSLTGYAQSFYASLPSVAVQPVTLGSGPQSIVLGIAEDAFEGNAQFTVSVDGTQIGGVQTASAQHGSGQTQPFTLDGNWGRGSHQVIVKFLNAAWNGTYTRRLYVNTVTAGGVTQTTNTSLSYSGQIVIDNSPVLWTPTTPVMLGSGPQSITVNISESAWQGDAQFTLAVDGTQIGGVQTATAEHAAGLSQAFTLAGSFSPGVHVVTVTPLNYAYGGAMPLQRFLDVDSISAAGTTTTINSSLTGYIESFKVTLPAAGQAQAHTTPQLASLAVQAAKPALAFTADPVGGGLATGTGIGSGPLLSELTGGTTDFGPSFLRSGAAGDSLGSAGGATSSAMAMVLDIPRQAAADTLIAPDHVHFMS